MGYYADLSLTFTPDSGKCTDIFPGGAPSKFERGARKNFIAPRFWSAMQSRWSAKKLGGALY